MKPPLAGSAGDGRRRGRRGGRRPGRGGRGRRPGRAGGRRRSAAGRLIAAAAEPDLRRPLDQVDGRQVVLLHHPDEMMDPADVVRRRRAPGARSAIRPFLRSAPLARSGSASRRSGRSAPARLRPGSSQAGPHRVEVARQGREDFGAVGGHQDVVLDPDAAPVGQVDARLDRSGPCPASARSSAPVRSRGASWTSRPMPWPSPWSKKRPKPASSITERAAASTSPALAPGRIRGDRPTLGLQDDPVEPARISATPYRSPQPASSRSCTARGRGRPPSRPA